MSPQPHSQSREALIGRPRDIAFALPKHLCLVPPSQRAERAQWTTDLCVIDDRDYLIRGILAVPVPEEQGEFTWGVWARVARADFEQYVDAWESDSELQVPLFTGQLSGGIEPYTDADRLDVVVHLQGGGLRPRFLVISDRHPLGQDQRHGITTAEADSMIAHYRRQEQAAESARATQPVRQERGLRRLIRGLIGWFAP
ncbi:MAG: DUF2199 domain-containing protein [Chloroflexi bacterium]|nr:DUF2199 domain-containing protein [Chloroflexota bacterium]